MRDGPSRPSGPRGRSRPSPPGRASRPATRRPVPPGAGAATRTSAPRPPGRLTGRAVVLGVVLLALALSYVLPLRIYLSQQAEISQLRDAQTQQRAHIAELEAEAERWQDAEYIRIQARKRLHYVEPGEIPMIIVWDDPDDHDAGRGPDVTPQPATPWWDTLWSSVRLADHGRPGDPDQLDGSGPGGGEPAGSEPDGAEGGDSRATPGPGSSGSPRGSGEGTGG